MLKIILFVREDEVNGIMIDISVIIPLYKGEKYLEYWIDILTLNFENYRKDYNLLCEAIFVNDYPDEKLLLENKDKCLNIYNLNENHGIHGARVFGYRIARGNYIVFLDQDDMISEDYLVSQRGKIGKADAIVCNGYKKYLWMRGKRQIYLCESQWRRIQRPENNFFEENPILSPGQVLIKRNAIPSIWLNEIMERNGADDYYLWILMKKKGCIFEINHQLLFTHIYSGHNASNDSIGMSASVLEMIKLLKENDVLENAEIEKLQRREKEIDDTIRHQSNIMKVYDYWMFLSIRNVKLEKYFNEKKFHEIAIYGMNYLGNRLYDALEFSPINVMFGIDKYADGIEYEIPIYNLKSEELLKKINQIDAVVVTAVSSYKSILCEIKRICNKPIVSLEDICLELIEKDK